MRPRSAQQDPEKSVGTAQAGPLSPAIQDQQLLPQGDVFKSQVMTRPNKASQPREHTPQISPSMNPFLSQGGRVRC
jgi:hypothetical protein